MATILLDHLPEPSLRSFVERSRAIPLAHVSELVSAMDTLRPDLFEDEDEYHGDLEQGKPAPESDHDL
jgi:hypothetical protein